MSLCAIGQRASKSTLYKPKGALPPIPKFVDTTEAIDELPSYDSFEPAPDDF